MIDWSRLRELRDEIGAETLDEVATQFAAEVQDVLDRLRPDAPRDGLQADLHFLKGSALSLGFAAFSDLCHDGERLSGESAADRVDLAALIACYQASHRAFAAGRHDQLAPP